MQLNTQSRRCLRCGNAFASAGPGNRICSECAAVNRGSSAERIHRSHGERRLRTRLNQEKDGER